MRAHRFLLAGFLGVIGCGNNGLTVPDGGDLSVPVDMAGADVATPLQGDMFRCVTASEFDLHLAQAICAHLLACGQLDAANMAACVQANTNAEAADRDTEIMKGRMCINESQCVSSVMGARCDGEDSGGVFIGQCFAFLFRPMQPSNGTSACISSVECINGYCNRGAPTDAGPPEGCPGVCTPFKSAGAVCNTSEECNANVAICDGTKHCATLPAAGASCAAAGQCQFGSYCPASMTCVMPTVPAAMGAACDPLQSIATTVAACQPGLYCNNTSMRCAAKLASGATCNPVDTPFSSGDNQCPDGQACFQVTGQASPICQTFKTLGQACDVNRSSCKATLYCDTGTATCKALLADGTTCDPANNHCLSGSTIFGQNNCIGSTPTARCVPMKTFNETCSPTTDSPVCASGYCSSVTNRCAAFCM